MHDPCPDGAPLVTAEDVRAADAAAARAGVGTETLMEAAGRAVAERALAHWPTAGQVTVACGPGDNGGDGYVAARWLLRAGRRVRVVALPDRKAPSAATAAARAAWTRIGEIEPADPARLEGAEAPELWIDALFGTGLSRPLDGAAAAVAELLGRGAAPVLSVDLPSGVASDAALPPGPHVRADRTVQFGWPRIASALAPARFAFGVWEMADIGIPAGALPDAPAPGRPRLLGAREAAAALPEVAPGDHKYRRGTVLIVGGSERWSGAAELACRGAHRAGAGLVTLATPAPFPGRWPETMLLPLAPEASDAVARALRGVAPRHARARVLGPGLDPSWAPLLPDLIGAHEGPTVLDAGALLPELRDAVRAHGACWLTPHAGEAARLLESCASDVEADPLGATAALAGAGRAAVVLKGAGSVVGAPEGRCWAIPRGHPGMASGGSGDVLAGVLGAVLAARPDDPVGAVLAGTTLHAVAGERAGARRGSGLRATEIAERLPEARGSLLECL